MHNDFPSQTPLQGIRVVGSLQFNTSKYKIQIYTERRSDTKTEMLFVIQVAERGAGAGKQEIVMKLTQQALRPKQDTMSVTRHCTTRHATPHHTNPHRNICLKRCIFGIWWSSSKWSKNKKWLERQSRRVRIVEPSPVRALTHTHALEYNKLTDIYNAVKTLDNIQN